MKPSMPRLLSESACWVQPIYTFGIDDLEGCAERGVRAANSSGARKGTREKEKN